MRDQADQVGAEVDIQVLVLVPWFPPLPRYSSERQHAADLAESGEFLSYEVDVVRVPYVPRWRFPESLVTALSTFFASLAVWFWVRRNKPKIDMVHAHMGLNSYIAAGPAKRLKAALVTTAHGSDINYGTERRPGNWFRRWATLRGVRASKRIVAVSDNLRQKIVELGVPKSKIAHIPNGYDKILFHPADPEESRIALDLPLDRKILVAVSSLAHVKGMDLLIDAFSKSQALQDNVTLYCVGDGPEAESLRMQVHQLRLDGRVVFVGQRPHEEVRLWMNACDLFVMSSRNEGWPTVLSEVLACGKPVVATAVGGVPEILVDEALGELVEPENPAALSLAIDINLNRSFSRNVISDYAQQFEWGAIVPQIMDVYRAARTEAP